MFYKDSTVLYDENKGIGESWYILCPVCWNASIRVVRWESGETETGECLICERFARNP
jgi:hypothetical protein